MLLTTLATPRLSAQPVLDAAAVERAVQHLIASRGLACECRIRQGVRQAALRWWAEDGNAAAFADFCDAHFLTDPAELAAVVNRLQRVLEQVDGHLHEVRRELTTPVDLDTGSLSAADRLLAGVDLQAHIDDDLFRSRVAFLALLNFPVHTLPERLAQGPGWTREQWARSRMMDRFTQRVPAAVVQANTRAYLEAEQYVSGYNIRMDRLVAKDGTRPFPEGLRLISHWGLRDELASHYDGGSLGLAKQRLILRVMERIVRQEIPAAVVDNPDLLWEPVANRVRPVAGETAADPERFAAREPDSRYAQLLSVFRAAREMDPFCPTEPTFMARRFARDRQMPEQEVEALLVSVLDSPEVRRLARWIAARLDRPLEPFDIWYSGFKSRGGRCEAELDRVVQARFPDLPAFQEALPRTLRSLGFAPETAAWLAEHIVVDPARGAGHALGAVRREDKAHLRTRVPRGGMDYKGYNIAIHELGHNVEQVFSLNGIDCWWLAGVPNNAFTEAFAFVFQNRDLELLGLMAPGPEVRRREALGTLWNTYEIAGVSLVDMRVWSWMYAHPEATPAELREAVLAIAREVWNRHFAPVLGAHTRDSEILAVYSHMIVYGLYLPDYALGHIIAFQVAGKLRGEDFGAEVERMARQGRLTPDAWMRGAMGDPVSTRALLDAAREALAAEGGAGVAGG